MTPDPRLAALRAAADRCEVKGFTVITIDTADLSFLLDALAAAEGEKDHAAMIADEWEKRSDALAARLAGAEELIEAIKDARIMATFGHGTEDYTAAERHVFDAYHRIYESEAGGEGRGTNA